jgi:hypothetical protein
MKKLLLSVCLLFYCASVATAGGQPLQKPDTLNQETIYLTQKISSNYVTLLIIDFSSEGVEYRNANDEEKSKIQQMLPQLKSNITQSLEGELKSKKNFSTIVLNGAASGKVLILDGRFSEFNVGSPALKFFGAGKACIKYKGKLIDGATGKDLALFEDLETGLSDSMSSSDSFEDLFPHQSNNIGKKLAIFLEKLF